MQSSHPHLVVKRIALAVPLALLLGASLAATSRAQAVAPAKAKSETASPSAKWEKDIRAFEAADRTSPPPKGAVLFIGASSVRRWTTLAEDFPEVKVSNRGFGGSQM